jgi:hypothetical protein
MFRLRGCRDDLSSLGNLDPSRNPLVERADKVPPWLVQAEVA